MRLILISDTHESHNGVRLPDGDVLIHAGDLTFMGHYDKTRDALEWLAAQPHKHKIVIAGNHDWLFQVSPYDAAELVAGYGVTYLQDQAVKIGDLLFYGSPWQPRFFDWAFNANSMRLREIWAKIPTETDVLITHGPPYGILDQTVMSGHAGCQDLRQEIFDRIKPELHVFGHIHSGYGMENQAGTTFCNAALLDEAYHLVNEPWTVDL